VEYCNGRSEQERLEKVYQINGTDVTADFTANGYRLPTEAEWEYAARNGGRKVRFGNGQNTADPSQMNFNASEDYKTAYSLAGIYRKKTTTVGSFTANDLGIYDMSGNIYEWCWDWYGAYMGDIYGPESGSERVDRGGSWNNSPQSCRAANRGYWNPSGRDDNLGFRLARTP